MAPIVGEELKFFQPARRTHYNEFDYCLRMIKNKMIFLMFVRDFKFENL